MDTMAITAQNKSELGMNRNDFFEYKKSRIFEMIKAGADVPTIASDLGLDEKGVYAFISRNFGGLKRLKEMVESQSTGKKKRGRPSAKDKKTVADVILKGVNSSIMDDKAIAAEKKKIIAEFKSNIDKEIQNAVPEIEINLDKIKLGIMNKFKHELMQELSAMAKKF